MHGIALNVSTDIEWFELINPCGLTGSRVTSISAEAGRKIPVKDVKKVLVARLAANLGVNLV
jgi:lipoyl(octanoyl) transferase